MTDKLTEFDETEWRDVARRLCPEMTDEDFAAEWAEFQRLKQQKKKH